MQHTVYPSWVQEALLLLTEGLPIYLNFLSLLLPLDTELASAAHPIHQSWNLGNKIYQHTQTLLTMLDWNYNNISSTKMNTYGISTDENRDMAEFL